MLRDLSGSQEIVVFNDEAHHCYRGQAIDDEKLTGVDRAEAKERNEEARVWLTGLQAIRRVVGVKTVYDLSATPVLPAGSGYQEGTLFPWVVSDFSLIDAIESGIVKIPRMPVDDNQVSRTVTYLDLWSQVRDELPKGGRRGQGGLDPAQMPDTLETALRALYDSYRRRFETWQEAADEGTPPVFMVGVQQHHRVQLGPRLDRGLRARRRGGPRRAAAVLQRRRGRTHAAPTARNPRRLRPAGEGSGKTGEHSPTRSTSR